MTFPCGRCTVTSTHGCYACVWATSRCPAHCLPLRNNELFCPAASSTNAPRMTAKRIPSKTGRPGSGENEGAWRAGGSRRAPRVHRRGLPHSSVLISPPRHPPEVSGVSIPVLHMKKPQHRELNFPSQALTTAWQAGYGVRDLAAPSLAYAEISPPHDGHQTLTRRRAPCYVPSGTASHSILDQPHVMEVGTAHDAD